MFRRLLSRSTVFLFVTSHRQLQQYLRVHDTHQAANERGRGDVPGPLSSGLGAKVVPLHPGGGCA